MSQRDPEGSPLDGVLAFERPCDDLFLTLGGDLEQRLGLGAEFHSQIELVVQIVFRPTIAYWVLGIDLDQSLFVDVDAGKFEVKPAAEELLVARAVLEIGTGCPVDGGVPYTPLEQRLRLAFVFFIQQNIRGGAGIKNQCINVLEQTFIAWPTVGDGGFDAGVLIEALGQESAFLSLIHI